MRKITGNILTLMVLVMVFLMTGISQAYSKTEAPQAVKMQTMQVNINTASPAELVQVKGIGPALAERIETYRTQNGPFTSVDDLANIKGIGNSTLEKIKQQVTL